ncbi:hypothetical protein A616_16980 [Brevibacillus brevis X23]|nr:hypothetical protein A616_16980 [Brevibacillus brevis X23]
MYLHIIWNDLLQDGESVEIVQQQRSLFQSLYESEIEEALVTISSDFKGESYPHSFEMIVTQEPSEKLRKVIEKNGISPSRDEFTRPCISCNRELRTSMAAWDVEWYFDESFKKDMK